MYDVLEQQLDGQLSREEWLELDELFFLRNIIRARLREIENSGTASEHERLLRAKLIAKIFDPNIPEGQSGRIKEMVRILESENRLIHYGGAVPTEPTGTGTSFGARRLSEPLNTAHTHEERQMRYSEPPRPLYYKDQGQQAGSLDTTLKGLWNRGKDSFSSISAAFVGESASSSLPKPIRDTTTAVSEKANGLLQDSKHE